jgi:hypothetical protein
MGCAGPSSAEQVAPAAWRGTEVDKDDVSGVIVMKRKKMMGSDWNCNWYAYRLHAHDPSVITEAGSNFQNV